jgi:selenium metabolism protein YedF
MSNIIDCKGLKCPQPVINTKKYFDSMEAGEATVVVDNEVAKNNILKFAQGSSLNSEAREENGLYYIKISKEKTSCEEIQSLKKKTTLVISTNKLGEGDEALGTLLMKSYLYALSESDSLPDDLIFLNSGVKLTTEGSESIESIRKVVEKGTNVLSCGTCLDYYGLKEKLLVGEISNMYTIVEKMNKADNTIKI